MAKLHFPVNLVRQVECPDADIEAVSVAELFECYFNEYPKVRSYVLDDQGHVRKHISVLVDGINLRDRAHLSDGITHTSEIYIFQALSGG